MRKGPDIMERFDVRTRMVALALSLAILLVGLCGCSEKLLQWAFAPQPMGIQTGFSEDLVNALEQGYGISIPENAVFVEGYHDGAILDPSVVIAFEIDWTKYLDTDGHGSAVEDIPHHEPNREDLVKKLVSAVLFREGEWHYYGTYTEDVQADSITEKHGISYSYVFVSDKVDYTYLYYTVTADGYGYFCFRGHHPGTNLPGYSFE